MSRIETIAHIIQSIFSIDGCTTLSQFILYYSPIKFVSPYSYRINKILKFLLSSLIPKDRKQLNFYYNILKLNLSTTKKSTP